MAHASNPELQRLSDASTGLLSRTGEFDRTAFDELLLHLWDLAGDLQGKPDVPKEIVRTIRSAISTIDAASSHQTKLRDEARVEEFETLLDRLVAG